MRKLNKDELDVPKMEQNCHGRCCKCEYYEKMMQKYSKLVELLNKKIIQLNRKVEMSVVPVVSNREGEKTSSTFRKSQKTDDRGSERGQTVDFVQLQETDSRLNFNKSAKMQGMGTKTHQFWRTGSIVNSLTQEVLQLKSNFMHIRQCVYSLFQESKMWKFIKKNETGVNVALVLFNIFEYSQQEREEMCRVRKVKVKTLRKEEESKENQNTYRTVKDIC